MEAVIEKLNELKLEDLKVCENELAKFELQKSQVEKQIEDLSHINPIGSTLTSLSGMEKKLDLFTKSNENIISKIEKFLSKSEDVDHNDWRDIILTVNTYENYLCYLHWLHCIEILSSNIQSASLIGSITRSLQSYQALASLAVSLQVSQCHHLKKFAKETLLYWHNILRTTLSSELDEILKGFQWPVLINIVSTKTSIPDRSETNVQDLESCLKKLHTISLPHDLQPEWCLHDIVRCQPPILPIQVLMEPLRKRFKFHFYGRKQTNNISKPEWMFTTVLTWIRDHQQFLTDYAIPALKHQEDIDIMTEFIRGLVYLLMEKVSSYLKEIVYDDQLFSHLLDETLNFDREINQCHDYPKHQPFCVLSFTQKEAFSKWISLEKNYALERMDELLVADDAWSSAYATDDGVCVIECTDGFVTLLSTILERCHALPDEHRIQFVGLQLELLDDFRIRLLQVRDGSSPEPVSGSYCAILNAVHYLKHVLLIWSESLVYLHLNIGRLRQDPEAKDEIFGETIGLLEHIEQEMSTKTILYVFDDVKARTRAYRRHRWMSEEEFEPGMTLTMSACEMMLILKDHIHFLQSILSPKLFYLIWTKVTSHLDDYLYSELILMNQFSAVGSKQLQFDMNRNLFPLFGQFCQRPENLFKKMKESCILLNLSSGSARMLQEVLEVAVHPSKRGIAQDPVASLDETGIFKFSIEESLGILRRRTDLKNVII